MNFLKSLIDEIKQVYVDRDSVYQFELTEYRDRFYTHCLNQLENKPSGFVGWVSFSNDTTKKFNEALNELNIQILENPVDPLHDYDLTETGLNRLHELERKIKKV